MIKFYKELIRILPGSPQNFNFVRVRTKQVLLYVVFSLPPPFFLMISQNKSWGNQFFIIYSFSFYRNINLQTKISEIDDKRI